MGEKSLVLTKNEKDSRIRTRLNKGLVTQKTKLKWEANVQKK